MTKGFHVASSNCYGCKTCTIACANEHLLTAGVYLRRVREIDAANPIGQAFVSMSCNHCDDPACVAKCPVGAYTKQEDTGLVIQDHEKCIGCKSCIEACPFHAPAYCKEDSTTYKCDGCIDRLNAGLTPVCTVVCPSANIAFDDFDALTSAHADAASIKDEVDTKPNLVVTLDKDIAAGVFTDIDGNANLVDAGGENY